MSTTAILCTNCGRPYPTRGLPYQCQKCGGMYDFTELPAFDPVRVDRSLPGIWRYRFTFGLPEKADVVTLGEGNTPLVPTKVGKREIYFKCEYQNPTGSFKDRGSALIAAWLKGRGIKNAVEDSSGNAGASFAAYAARAGIRARIFVPASASGPKRNQIEAYGADLELVPGSRSDVAEAVRRAVDANTSYASHAWLPFNLPGYATAAYEIFEQLGGELPGAVIVPAGQGGLLLGLARGFDSLRVANILAMQMQDAKQKEKINTKPRAGSNIKPAKENVASTKIIGVQARACAPLWAMFAAGHEGLGFITDNPTLAEGVRVFRPLWAEAVLRAVSSSGSMCAVDEEEIMPGREALAHLGFYVEPTSAIVWPVLQKQIHDLPDPVVVVLTGSGLKYG
jgi:threonine synthase